MDTQSIAQRESRRPTILRTCPQAPNGISFPSEWYRFPDIKDFWICTKCYSDKLANTKLAYELIRFYDEPLPGSQSICDFNSERVNQFLGHANVNEGFRQLKLFAAKRQAMMPCEGIAGVSGGCGVRWYSTPDIPSFVVCEACYEDTILATSFAPLFSVHPDEHKPEVVWACDVAVPFVRRTLLEFLNYGDWQQFVGATKHRLTLPSCTPNAVKMLDRKWFTPVKPWPVPQFMICEASFSDNFSHSIVGQNLAEVNLGQGADEKTWICDLMYLPGKICTQELLTINYARWHRLVTELCSKPTCGSKGIVDGKWYTIPHPNRPGEDISNFDVCAACHLGLFVATGYGHLLREKYFAPGTRIFCDFCPGINRSPQYTLKWKQMISTSDSSHLIQYARIMAALPVCSRTTGMEHQPWWGEDEFFFCRSCFEEAGRDTYFAVGFRFQGTVKPSECWCDMYSDNMRRRYIEACRARDLTEFRKYCQERQRIYEMRQSNIKHNETLARIQKQSMRVNLVSAGVSRNAVAMNHGASAAAHGQHYNPMTDMAYQGANNFYNHVQTQALLGPMLTGRTPVQKKIEAIWRQME